VNSTTVMVIDEQELFRAGIRKVLSGRAGLTVLDSAPSEIALRTTEATKPDVVLLGCQLNAHAGLESAGRIAHRFPSAKVVVLSPQSDDPELFQVIKTSVVACVSRDATGQRLVAAVREASASQHPVSRVLPGAAAQAHPVPGQFDKTGPDSDSAGALIEPLTSRQKDILRHVAAGSTNKQIASTLHLSAQTVKNHVSSVLRKLNANDRAHAVYIGICLGWI